MPEFSTVAAFTLALLPLSAVNAAVTSIVTRSTLFAPLRALMGRLGEGPAEIISCSVCTGTWVGGGIAAVSIWWVGWTGLDAMLGGVMISLSTMVGGLILMALGDF